MRYSYSTSLFILIILAMNGLSCSAAGSRHRAKFDALKSFFDKGSQSIGIAGMNFDYKENLAQIQTMDTLDLQMRFFTTIRQQLQDIDRSKLESADQIDYDQIAYEVGLNEQRITLEKAFREQHMDIPPAGLYPLDSRWYDYYVRFYTSTDITPDQLYAFGEKEVARVKAEIERIQAQMGYAQQTGAFYKMLEADSFYLADSLGIMTRYQEISQTVLRHLSLLFCDTDIAKLTFMEWPGANKYTPPGYYSPAGDNKYGKPVFFFNFYNGRHNIRAMDWLYMHEGVPGHHYQWSIRAKLPQSAPFKQLFFYPGNAEGWAAYIEYYGKEMGLYRDPYSELGKWEWDLVRSVRVLIDVGIHHKGWTHEQALQCWMQNITGQDDIAEREVTRCTNWPAQALSYKVGAQKIMELRDSMQARQGRNFDIRKFHSRFLSYGNIPMQVIERDMLLR
ncbi:MAG: DUF885 domain-containing protein [Bacteroidetes bacterium]|nr:DUF885 domain-containing protein [Bacteroidota bacterium]